MKRRACLKTFILTLLAAPLAVEAQSARVPVVAILEPGPATQPSGAIRAILEKLQELGWIEGRTVVLERRYAGWRLEDLPRLAAELAELKPDVLLTHSDAAVREAAVATASVPIVVGMAGNLMQLGVVRSLARPGGNVTGVDAAQPELDRKRLELLREAVPSAKHVAFLFNPTAVDERWLGGMTGAAHTLRLRLRPLGLQEPSLTDAAFTRLAKEGLQAVVVQDSVVFSRQADKVVALALRHRLPAISQIPGFARRGGLLQYGVDVISLARRSATHIDKILRGARPADLPVEQPTKLDLTINLKTAKALGLTIPQSVLVRADEVIE